MSLVFFAADLHLGHRNILKYRDIGATTTVEHDEILIENIMKTVRPNRDTLYLLGDICFEESSAIMLKKAVGSMNVKILPGNHEMSPNVLAKYFDVITVQKYKKNWISHIPIHPTELRGKFNIHGHVHHATIDDPRYFNVSVDNIGYTPIKHDMIVTLLNSNNFDPTKKVNMHLK